MDTHLIVAVHGIGEQQPGETVDEIVSTATTQLTDGDPCYRPVTIEGDVIELADHRFCEEKRYGEFFPVHLRNIQAAQPTERDERAVFAEVYWADKSPAPKGPFWTIFDLLKVVLGLGYLAMENAESNRGRYSVWLVRFFIWIFYGFLAPINATLLTFALFLLLEATPIWSEAVFDHLNIVFFGHAVLTFAIGLYVRFRVATTHLMSFFGNGLIALGGLFGTVLWLSTSMTWINTALCGMPDAQSADAEVIAVTQNIGCYLSAILRLMEISWIVIISLAFAIAVIGMLGSILGLSSAKPSHRYGAAARIRDSVTGIRVIYPSICAAMVIFWSVIATSLWLFLLNVASRLSEDAKAATGTPPPAVSENEQGQSEATPSPASAEADPQVLEAVESTKVTGVLQSLLEEEFALVDLSSSLALMAAAILAVVLMFLVAVRKTWPHQLFEKSEWRSRLILNPIIRYLLVFGLALVALGLLPALFGSEGECPTPGLHYRVMCWINGLTPVFAAVLLVLGIVMLRFSNQISSGLGIFRDIVTYSVQERCAWPCDEVERARNFMQRDQINARFRRTIHYGLEAYEPQRVTIIAHSLGSIIATRMMHDPDVKALLAKNGNPEVVLITMGSPATHIYRRYFKEFFQVSTDDMPLAFTPNGAVNKAWYNIHREDDFVGTRIGDDPVDTPDLAQNFPVEPGGHTGYFTDYHVWKVLRDQIGFRLFPSQFMTRRREAAE